MTGWVFNTPCLFRRIAVRASGSEQWQWFNDPIPSYLLDELGPHEGMDAHERKMLQAVIAYPQVQQVEVRNEREYPQIDWDACLATLNSAQSGAS